MYPSKINGHTNSTLDQSMPYYKPSLSDQNPLTLTPSSSSSFLNSPSPYIRYEDDLILQYYLFPHQPLIPEASAPDSNKSEIHKNDKFMSLVEQINPRKRCYKKDRHSKIETAQGPRDRRMRLSLEVARKFFNLQDMLGFDKASKTVGWLLTKSKTVIEELKRGFPHVKNSCSVGGNNYSASSTSECEVVSGIDESAVDENWHGRKGKSSKTLGKGKKNVRAILRRKSAFDPIARESRDKARARARERTREKKKLDESKLPLEGVLNRDTNRLGSWSCLEKGEGSGTQHLDLLADVEDLSSSMIFNHNNGISHENHFTDFQVYGKSWEAYNNINLCKQSPNVFFGDLSGQY